MSSSGSPVFGLPPFSVNLGIEPVDWMAHGDEWIVHLGQGLREAGRSLAQWRSGENGPFVRLQASDMAARLFVGALQDGGAFLVVAGDNELDPVEVEAWVSAATAATGRLGSASEDFPWVALIGRPISRFGGGEGELDVAASIGPFRVSPMGKVLREAGPGGNPSLHSWSFHASWPILVSGIEKSYAWPAASTRAASKLHGLCGLLAVAWGECYVVRESPSPDHPGRGRPVVPDVLPWQSDSAVTTEQPAPQVVLSVPSWASDGWARMETSKQLADAVSAHHEGLRAEFEHPSLALVAFVASIEAIGNLLFKTQLCSCGLHKNVRTRFEATLRRVVDDEWAIALGDAYESRSLTVHQGQLHGTERSRGSIDFAHFSADSSRGLFLATVLAMRRANRDLLLWALQNDRPSRRKLTESDRRRGR